MANDVLKFYSLTQLYQLQTDIQHEIDKRQRPLVRVRLVDVRIMDSMFSMMYTFERGDTGHIMDYHEAINQPVERGAWYLVDGDVDDRYIHYIRKLHRVDQPITSISPFSSSSIIARSNNFTVETPAST